MKLKTGVAVLALVAGSGITAPAPAEDVSANDTAAAEAEWQQILEARLTEDARTIAADAMSAASKIDVSARLDREQADAYQVLALANER